MKSLFFALIAISIFFFKPNTVKADINFATYSVCWYEVDGEHYFRVVTNRPTSAANWDTHIYVNIPGTGWTSKMSAYRHYTDPSNIANEVFIFKLQQHSYSLPSPLASTDCFQVFVHPNSNVISPSEFYTVFTACQCPSDCDASIRATIYSGYVATLEPANYPWTPTDPNDYFWSYGDGTYSNLHSLSKIFPGPGSYTVCLTIDNGSGICKKCITICFSEEEGEGNQGSAQNKKINTGIASETGHISRDFYLYPNPANDIYTIQVNSKSQNDQAIIVTTDFSGKVISKITNDIHLGSNKLEFSTIGMPSGIYHVKIFTNNSGSFVTALRIVK